VKNEKKERFYFIVRPLRRNNDSYFSVILFIISEIKLEQMQITLATFEQQNQVKNKVEQKKSKQKKTNINPDKKDKPDWKYPTKMQ
jgi:hypothetical protein